MDISNTSWNFHDDFLFFGELPRLTKLLARYDLFKEVLHMPGDIVECGVFKGGGVLFWAKLLEIFAPLAPRKVVGFDTFEGYPEDMSKEYDKMSADQFVQKAKYIPVLPDEIIRVAKALKVDHRIELVKGDCRDTMPQYIAENPGFRVSLLNLDFDIYDSTKAALNHFYPLIVTGGVIILDEYGRGWGEADAVDEFFFDKSVTFRSFPWTLSPTAYIRKGQ